MLIWALFKDGDKLTQKMWPKTLQGLNQLLGVLSAKSYPCDEKDEDTFFDLVDLIWLMLLVKTFQYSLIELSEYVLILLFFVIIFKVANKDKE